MSRRHDSLIPLTHDHHHTLAQAKRLSEAVSLDTEARRRTADDFVNFYFGKAVRHFHEEEELFFAPLIDVSEARDLVIQAVSDHLRLHSLVREVKRQLSTGTVEQELLSKIGKLLVEHVRLEEQKIFPLVETLVPEEHLQDLATAGRREV
jgi:hemerythrin superfamily protein